LAVAAVSLLAVAAACGTETDVNQAPSSIGKAHAQAASPWDEPAGDAMERLVTQAKSRMSGPRDDKTRYADTSGQVQSELDNRVEPQYLPPTARPVPLPGQNE
jgi:hypothetical protein